MASLLIIEVDINFSLGFDNTDYQTKKLQNVHALHFTLVLYIVPEGPEKQLDYRKMRAIDVKSIKRVNIPKPTSEETEEHS